MNISAGILLTVCFVLTTTTSKPVSDLLDSNDSQSVGSIINKVFAPAPFEDLQVAGTGHKKHRNKSGESGSDEEDGGYYASKSTKGDNGYKHFDSYHKKGGDSYGFEKHASYGKGTGGKKGKSHHTSSSYHEADGDAKGSEKEIYSGEGEKKRVGAHIRGSEVKKNKAKNNKAKDHKTAATDGDFYVSNYEEGEGDSEHYEGDDGHYEEEGGEGGEGGYFSESYSEGEGEGDGEGYYEGEGESEGYYDGEGESRQRSVIHHGGPSPGATSYSVRHF